MPNSTDELAGKAVSTTTTTTTCNNPVGEFITKKLEIPMDGDCVLINEFIQNKLPASLGPIAQKILDNADFMHQCAVEFEPDECVDKTEFSSVLVLIVFCILMIVKLIFRMLCGGSN